MAQRLRQWFASLGLIVSNEEALEIEAEIAPYISPLQSYPSEILQQIAMNLPYRNIIALCLASRDFQYKICADQDFWRTLYKRDLSDNTAGIHNFQKSYHVAVTPVLIGDQPNKKAWTLRGYEVITGNPQFYDTRNHEIMDYTRRDYGPYLWEILQSLDHHWDKRTKYLIDETLRGYEHRNKDTYKILKQGLLYRCLVFLAAKGDVELFQRLIKTYEVRLQDFIIGDLFIAYSKSRPMLDYLFGILSPSPDKLEEMRETVLSSGTLESVQYLLAKNPPTQLTRDQMIDSAEFNKQNPDVLEFVQSLE